MRTQTQHALSLNIKKWLGAVAVIVFALLILNPVERLLHVSIGFNHTISIIPPLTADAWINTYNTYLISLADGFIDSAITLPLFQKLYILTYMHMSLYVILLIMFFIPLILFIIKKNIPTPFIKHCKILSIIMVTYGFGLYYFRIYWNGILGDNIYFIPFEVLFLITIYGYNVWQLLLYSNLKQTQKAIPKPIKKSIFFSIHIMGITLIIGTFVASLNAGYMYNDFPLMSGEIIPSNYFELSPFFINFFENHATVQFNHRVLAYTTVISTILLYKKIKYASLCPLVKRSIHMWCIVVALQVFIGIATLISSVHFYTAIIHQCGMILAVSVGLYTMYITKTRKYNS